MYFRLNPECYFIKGGCNGAIYDLIDGNVYALDSSESQKIEDCENNRIVDPADPFLLDLRKRVVGNFYPEKVFIQKLRLGSPIAEYQQGIPPVLSRAFLEIGNHCDRSCWYCGYHGISRSMGCLGCNIWPEDGMPVSTDRWKELIDELHLLQCRSLFIKGGDLSKEWKKTCDLLNYADKKFEKIYITGHRAHLSKEACEQLKNVAYLILQTDSLEDIDDQFVYLFTTENQDADRLTGPPHDNVIVDRIYRNLDRLNPGSHQHLKRSIEKTSLERFTHNNILHPCLGNSITISWNGKVLPCPMMRKHSLGNIMENKLWTFLTGAQGSIQKYWNINLNTLKRCNICEFRYACIDCRALEAALTGDLYSKLLCTYDPSKGT